MNGGSEPYKSDHFLKECNENFQYGNRFNRFNRLRFFDKVSTKLQKSTILDKLRTITQETWKLDK